MHKFTPLLCCLEMQERCPILKRKPLFSLGDPIRVGLCVGERKDCIMSQGPDPASGPRAKLKVIPSAAVQLLASKQGRVRAESDRLVLERVSMNWV